MKWTSLNDLREKYLSFFESKGHLRHASYSLIPKGDRSLLLINAGMAPLKKYFTGEEEPPRHRMTTCQKCVRTLDIDNVGKTDRHGTYFEMLGNFSFGDYFKNEAIPWAWEFLTEVLEIPADLLYPSVFEEDDEAFEIWNKTVGVPADRIVRLGREDNFWEHGSGPCGPCSEIYFDRGEKYGCGSPDCGPGCECDRFIEVWNNVFTQFNSDGKGNYSELDTKNIDTGMGLERLACVMQSVDNLFEVDTIRKILDKVCEISGTVYKTDETKDVSIRVIADHARSSVFLISDGVLPSNEGRGYVLRRLVRRALRHGKLLGIRRAFLTDVAEVVIGENKGAYPELAEKHDYIMKILSLEEEKFEATIDQGLSILNTFVENSHGGVLDGKDAFKLYDTFGFPVDLTREIVAEKGLSLDEEGFAALMKEQKQRARDARKSVSGWDGFEKDELSDVPTTDFVGYSDTECGAKVVCIIGEGEKLTGASEGDVTVILDRTVFYGEGGGQVGDVGTIAGDTFELEVYDTKKNDGVYLHLCHVKDGTVTVGDAVTASLDTERRDAIKRNHSAAHLLQAALRRVLGGHVEQAGSYVDANEVRFDFSHYAAVTAEELEAVESLVNGEILKGEDIVTVETDVETARKNGAVALFDDKYGSVVRMVKMGDFSTELCGGTHCDNTSKVGLFKIVSESSVASGVRRITGVTGAGVLSLLRSKEELISDAAKSLKVSNPADLPLRARQLTDELSEAKRQVETLNGKLAAGRVDGLLSTAKEVGACRLIAQDLGATGADAARMISDKLRDKDPSVVAVFALKNGEKLNFLASCGADAVKAGAHAGKLVGAVSAVTGGKGGGRPDSAMSGGRDADKIPEALGEAESILLGMLK